MDHGVYMSVHAYAGATLTLQGSDLRNYPAASMAVAIILSSLNTLLWRPPWKLWHPVLWWSWLHTL